MPANRAETWVAGMVSGKHGIEEKAVYPYSVDVPADPERRYILTIYFIAKWACAALFITMIAAIAIAMHERSRATSPVVIYWSERDSHFGGLLPSNDNPYESVAFVDEQRFMEEYFLRTYVDRMFATRRDSDWCDCRGGTRAGLFDYGRECFICNFSSPDVFNEAASSLRGLPPGDFQINKITQLGTPKLFQPEPSFSEQVMGRITGHPRQYEGQTTSRYRVDFRLGSSLFSAFYTLVSPHPNPRYFFTVTSANYVFDTSGDGA